MNESEQSLGIAEYYRILDRHKWAVAFFLLLPILFAVWHNSKLIPIYSAKTTMIIDRETKSPLPGQRRFYESYVSETLTFNTHFQMINSTAVLKRVVESLHLDKKQSSPQQPEIEKVHPFKQYPIIFKKNVNAILDRFRKTPDVDPQIKIPITEDPVTRIARSLKGLVTVSQIEETRLFTLTAVHSNPVMARDLANTVAQSYIDFNIDSRMKASQNTLKWLTRNLEEMKRNLEKAEKEFTDFKQAEKLISIEKSQEMIAHKIREFNNTFIDAKNRRLEIETKLKQLKKTSGSKDGISRLRALITSSLINTLYSELLDAEVEFSRMSQVYKTKHPKILQIKTKISIIRTKIRDEIKKEIYQLNTERSILLSKEKIIQSTVTDFKQEAMEIGKKELDHNIFQRNVEMNQRLYDAILSSLKETDLTQNLDVSNIRILERAVLPKSPKGPNKKQNLIIAVIIGLMLGVAYSFSWEFMDRSLKTEEDAQKYLNLPVLGIIPKVSHKKQ